MNLSIVERTAQNIKDFIELQRIQLLIFFSSFFLFLLFAGTRILISDEGVILDQFYNLINGSLIIKASKINVGSLINIGDNFYGKFSYSLLILSLPVYYILKIIESLYGAHIFILQLWALSGGFIAYLVLKIRGFKNPELYGVFSYFLLIAGNLYFFEPINFPKWGEFLSIELTNILISSFLILVVYIFFRDLFNEKIAIFASFFIIFATPISIYAVTLKHHSITILLTLMAFYFFYKYQKTNEDRYIYFAYVLGGLCVWTRFLDGLALLVSLFVADMAFFRPEPKRLFLVFVITIISLIPYLGFNYIMTGNPFMPMDIYPKSDSPLRTIRAENYITLGERISQQQLDLLVNLGYRWNETKSFGWFDIFGYIFFLKLVNTFGIFLVSPFLACALVFIVEKITWKEKISTIDKLLGIYLVAISLLNKDYIIKIVVDTPFSIEYRYLLFVYIVLLYFALRITGMKEIIEINMIRIIMLSCILLIALSAYFIAGFPFNFLDRYYYAALIMLMAMVLSTLLLSLKKWNISNKIFTPLIAASLAMSSFFSLFYYGVESMTYVSPSLNHAVLPIMGNVIKWMYQLVFGIQY